MLCCPVQVQASETGWSLVQRSPTVCLNTIMQKARGNHCIKKILTDITIISSSWELLQTNLNDWKQWERERERELKANVLITWDQNRIPNHVVPLVFTEDVWTKRRFVKGKAEYLCVPDFGFPCSARLGVGCQLNLVWLSYVASWLQLVAVAVLRFRPSNVSRSLPFVGV
jgi:hypothetical protein